MLPGDPFDPTAPAISAEIPLLIGSTEFEVNFFPNAKFDPIDDAALHAAFKQATHASDADVDKLIAVYKKGRPGYSNVDLSEVVASDNFRAGVITEAERKAAQKAPVYMYYFRWRSPVHDGKLKAFHTLEIPFVLANVDEAKTMTGTGQDRYALQEKMSGAWAAFARSGNPNHKGLAELAGVQHHQARDHDFQQRMQSDERSGRRRASGLERAASAEKFSVKTGSYVTFSICQAIQDSAIGTSIRESVWDFRSSRACTYLALSLSVGIIIHWILADRRGYAAHVRCRKS